MGRRHKTDKPKMNVKILITALPAAAWLCSCSPDDGPASFEPHLKATGAAAVLHTEATLCGRISLQGSTEMPALRFLYGTTEAMGSTTEDALTEADSVWQRITGLTPGTTYHFCLMADNGRTQLRSNVLSFTTIPSGKPAVCEATDIRHTYATLRGQAEPLDDGTMPQLDFLVGTANGRMAAAQGTTVSGTTATLRLGGLTPGTAYRFCLRAYDGKNTTFSDTLNFTTMPSSKPTVSQPTDITRTSATLCGRADTLDNGSMPELTFLLGTANGQMAAAQGTTVSGTTATLRLGGLTPGTAYRFCLRAYDGYNTTFSDTLSFTTTPNKAPTITPPDLLASGPTSAMVRYTVADNGGEPLTATGLIVTNTANGTEQRIHSSADINAATAFTIRVGDLQQRTTYQIKAFAANTVGETATAPITVTTTGAVTLRYPGELAALIGNDIYTFSELAFAGPMNGDDLRLLRRMMGREPDGSAGKGRLASVDMTDATIVSGGDTYDGQRFARNNVVGQGLFAGCTGLTTLSLPDNATTVEQDAMRGCASLERLTIPSKATTVEQSEGCTALAAISVSPLNTAYSSQDGVLLTADGKQITWFPAGKTGHYALPPTVTTIGERAFAGSSITSVTMPDGITEMGQAAFAGSSVEEVTLPGSLSTVPTATFQECSRLHTVRIGSQTALISDYAFDGCPLRHIYLEAYYPPLCRPEAFTTSYSALLSQCTVHVPRGRSAAYKASEAWSRFANIVETDY